MTRFHRFLKDQRAATAIEYGLIASLIALAIISALTTLGQSTQDPFNTVSDSLTAATSS